MKKYLWVIVIFASVIFTGCDILNSIFGSPLLGKWYVQEFTVDSNTATYQTNYTVTYNSANYVETYEFDDAGEVKYNYNYNNNNNDINAVWDYEYDGDVLKIIITSGSVSSTITYTAVINGDTMEWNLNNNGYSQNAILKKLN